MPNQNNTVGITDDDIKKAKDYRDAMDALQKSISGVNSKLPEFSEGLQAGLKAIGEKLPEVVDAMVKMSIPAGPCVLCVPLMNLITRSY